MGRKRRELDDDCSFHITMRTNNRLFYFEKDECKIMFIKILKKVEKIYHCKIEVFMLMTNHVHLVIRPRKGKDLPGIMHRIAMTFAKQFNARFNQTGHVWGGRYHSRVLRSILEFENVFRYIAKNPVRANLVESTIDWFWSTISFYERNINLFINNVSDDVRILYEKYHEIGYKFD